MIARLAASLGLACTLLTGPSAEARTSRIIVEKVEAGTVTDARNGTPLPVERITGHAYGELDPHDSRNAVITDLDRAPTNAAGRVEYVARFTLTKPVDMARASGVLWYDLVNRGAPVPPNRGAARPIESGHVELISGWQGDIVESDANWTVRVPIARMPDGSSITGPVLARSADAKPGTTTRPLGVLSYPNPYDAASLDTTKAHLVAKSSETRAGEVGATREVASTDWAFADCTSVPFPGRPNPRMLCLKGGFDPALLYELVYQARDPKVLGVGLAAMRDVASFFRYETRDDVGVPNPVAGRLAHAVAQGISQSGNALKTFLLLGFNQDEAGRIVFDGANPHIGGRLTAVNVRFGVPSGSGTLYEPGGEGVLWWSSYEDKVRGRKTASLLDRCNASRTCPKIFETFGSTEFNARLMTVALTGTDGKADLPLPDNVRRYYFPGTTHNGDIDGGFDPAPKPASGCVMARNPISEADTMNALAAALVEWVVSGREPPASLYPRLDRGDLAANTREAMNFPSLPGVPSPTGMAVGLMDYDFGRQLDYNDFSGVIARQPPEIGRTIPSMMPKVNADGNETSGIGAVLQQAPLGTYTGWNVIASGFFKGQPCGGGLAGGYIPFATTRAERAAAKDPRPALDERYGTHQGYVCRVRAVTEDSVARRFLLRRDADRLIAEAETSPVLKDTRVTSDDQIVAGRLCDKETH